MTKTYTITEERLLALLDAEDELASLNAAGVDNWSGYEIAYGLRNHIGEVPVSSEISHPKVCVPITQDEYPQAYIEEMLSVIGLEPNKNYLISIMENPYEQ